jgi:hypothetical protein
VFLRGLEFHMLVDDPVEGGCPLLLLLVRPEGLESRPEGRGLPYLGNNNGKVENIGRNLPEIRALRAPAYERISFALKPRELNES